MKTKNKLAMSIFTAIALIGCGAESTVNVKEAPLPPIQGVIVDSPIAGISYSSDSVSNGTTNADGQFDYFRGEAITFSIGEIIFPSVAATNIITPLEIFNTDTAFHPAVINALRLLQTLDSDGDPNNGISISDAAKNAAQLNLAEGQTVTEFFSQDAVDFDAAIHTWLADAGTVNSALISADQAILHFVDYIFEQYNSTQPNAFSTASFNGEVFNPFLSGSTASLEQLVFSPTDDTNQSGTFSRQIEGEEIAAGSYEFLFGNRVLAFTPSDSSETQYIISRSHNTVNDAYSVCYTTDASALASLVLTCDNDEDAKDNIIVFSQEQATTELEKLVELADQVGIALSEDFDTDTENFFSSNHKKLSDEQGAGALYFKTGGSPSLDETLGQLTLAGARFSIGNTTPEVETKSSNTSSSGIYNISEGFTISFDVIDHNGSGSLSLYVDNNTTSQGNSAHGDASKFYGKSINEENTPVGQRFSYTYVPGEDVVTGSDLTSPDARGVLSASIQTSFFQLRTDSAASIIIDNLTIETVATDVPDIEPPVDPPIEPPVEPPAIIPNVGLPFSADFIGITADIFSVDYQTIVDADGLEIPTYTRTGGSVNVVADGLEISSGRFTIGNTTPDVDTTGDDTSTTGVFDLSRPYNVVMDIISVDDPDGDNNFQIYVDNNTSSSSKSIHGGDSKFYSELINTLTPGTTLTVPGFIATKNSFLQLRTESGGTVVVNNIRIEYIDENLLLEETFNGTSAETFFTAEYKSLPSDATAPLYNITGGGSAMVFANDQLTLSGSRFTMGETNPGTDTADGVMPEGALDLSKPYKVFVDIVAIDSASTMTKDFQVYVDNNTSSSSKSHLGGDSKFFASDLADLNVGQTLEIEGLLASTNSFLQFRTESSATVTIDNIRIEYLDNKEIHSDDFETTTELFFTAEYLSLPDDETTPLYKKTGGTVVIEEGQLKLDSGRFSVGNTTPDVDTSVNDTVTTGIFDLSQPYNITFDLLLAEEPTDDKGNSFQIYVDNNTSSSSKSIHGGSSKFYSTPIADLTPGKMVIEGYIATETSFLQFRTESGGIVMIDNLKVEYLADPEDDTFSCAKATELYFCDDFTSGNLNNWQILASTNGSTAEGSFDILTLEGGNKAMRYTAGGAGGELIVASDTAMANVPDSGNYFVEATIRPRQNSTTANKQLYLLGRYDSAGNWYGGGLNLQNSSSSTQVEVAISSDGSISRPVQTKSPLLLGEKDGIDDGVWYTTRFEMIDGDLTVYLNGEKMGSINDSTYTAKGLIGIFTNNRSFELDNLKVGDPSVKPIQLTLDYKDPTWETTTTTEALIINVSAFQDDGLTADSFTVTSSNPSVVEVSIDGNVITLTPTGEGEATVIFVSGSDSNIVRTIDISVASGFVMPTAEYGDISDLVTPKISSISQYIDTNLSITFDSAITLGDLGEVRIYKEFDDSIVDLLKVDNKKGTNVDVISAPDKTRSLNYTPISIAEDGKTLNIDPRNDVLEYGESYYVVISDDVVNGAQLNGIDFAGLGENSNWTFTTKFTAPSGSDILVDDDGIADFRTLQGALSYVMNNIAKDAPATISVKDGIYNEMLYLRNQNNITIQGESRENTIVQYDNYESFNGGSSGRPVFLVESADMLVLNNFTLKNSHIRSNEYSNQAETIYFNSSDRLVANNMNFISEQDTLLIKGYSWFFNTLVAGNVDFIWGYPVAALFEESEIRTIGDSKNGATDIPVSGGYILQSRTPVETDPGFVFLNGEFTNGPGPLGNTVADDSTYIARSAGKADAFDNVTLINNKLDTHIITRGWYESPTANPEFPTAASGWREYGSMDINGNPLDLTSRIDGYELSENETTSFLTRAAIFTSYNSGSGWEPQPLDIPILPDEPSGGADIPEANVGYGFAGYNFEVTGGAGGTTITVDNGADLISALSDAKSSNTPIIIYVDGTITDANSGSNGTAIDIKDMDNVSIVGVADRGEFDGIGISIRRANNIIIQNLKIHEVLTQGKDGISIEGDDDGSTTSNIWIDHNELYGSLDVDKDYYDGLIDSKSGAENITISYNYLHDSWKTSLHGHSDNDDSPNKNRHITFHHNRFENLESRVPLFRFGKGHIYNNYYNNINSTAINSRMGAELHIENNYFENTQNPIVSFYSSQTGSWNTSGNFFGENVTWSTPDSGDLSAEDGTSTSSYEAPYDYVLEDAQDVKAIVISNAGVNKVDQSDLDIPEITDTTPVDPPIQSTLDLPFEENFSATDADEFFSNSYRDLSGAAGSDTPLFHRVTGNVEVSNGELTITGARISISNTTPEISTTDADTTTTGLLDLSVPYQISFKVVAVNGNTDKNFQIYVDNNTSSSSKSIHGGASKFYSVALKDHVTGQTYVVDGLVASSTSFITIRSESDATITIDDLTIK
ncbi:pectinesterase family protein [Thalassotalea castellviae]|uniref:Pectinesterase family protein n=1 Tax=Thalassotalea castellviae TaxID=3075612 RepID=A0ABU2ZYU1_9GAMM|nr:pectinesterase family protein [Thalassotalea sp. W431]MDT0602507.1 pectinesterase family protein [Thalassotalea sp. W431]